MYLLALFLFATQTSYFSTAPTYPYQISSDLDFKTAYQSFFKVQELINKININRFEGFKNPEVKETFFKGRKEKPPPVHPILPDIPSSVIDNIPEIDLTEEAIQSDTAGIPVVDPVPEVVEASTEEPTTTTTAATKHVITTTEEPITTTTTQPIVEEITEASVEEVTEQVIITTPQSIVEEVTEAVVKKVTTDDTLGLRIQGNVNVNKYFCIVVIYFL